MGPQLLLPRGSGTVLAGSVVARRLFFVADDGELFVQLHIDLGAVTRG